MQLSGMKVNSLEISDVEKGALASSLDQQQQQQQQTQPVPILNQITTSPPERITSRGRRHSFHHSSSLRSQIWNLMTRKSGAGQLVDHDEPPDGGVQAWTIVVLCHFVGFHTWGFLNAFGVLQSYYVIALGRTPSDVSWIGSLQAFFLFFMSAFSGRLTDAGYFHQLLFTGSILTVLGYLAASFSTTYWQLLLCHSLCIGLGGGMIFIPSISLVATYFRRHRAMALALVTCGNSAGGLFYAAILQNTLPTIGFAWSMRLCGFIILATLIAANFLLKPRHIKRSVGPLVEWVAFTEPAYRNFCIGMFFSMIAAWIPVFYLGSFGHDIIHLSTHSAANLILIINGVGLCGRLVPAFLSHSLGPMNLMIPLTFLSAIVLFTWISVKTSTQVVIFDVLYGVFMAAAQGMLPPSLASLTHDLSKMGVRLGMVFSVLGFALLIGTPLAGWLISGPGKGAYLYAQVFAAGCMSVATVMLGWARWNVTGWKVLVKV